MFVTLSGAAATAAAGTARPRTTAATAASGAHRERRDTPSAACEAVDKRRIPANPAAGVQLPRRVPVDHVYLTHDQVADLSAECSKGGEIAMLLAYSGLRGARCCTAPA